MSLPDPITLATNPPGPIAKIVSPPGSSVFRKEFDGGASAKLTFFQSANAKRARHLARVDYQSPVDIKGNLNTMAITLSIDEPANGSIPDADVLYWLKVLMDTLTPAVQAKMLNYEL